MLAALIRPVESHTVEVAGASLDDVYAQISSHAPDGFDLVSAPVRMLKGTAGIQATARFDRRDGVREISADDMGALEAQVPAGWQMLSVWTL